MIIEGALLPAWELGEASLGPAVSRLGAEKTPPGVRGRGSNERKLHGTNAQAGQLQCTDVQTKAQTAARPEIGHVRTALPPPTL